jgi:hypothetical protein
VTRLPTRAACSLSGSSAGFDGDARTYDARIPPAFNGVARN